MEEECLNYSWLSQYSLKKYCCSASLLCLQFRAPAATTLCLHQVSINFVCRFWGMGKEITFTYIKKQWIF